MLRDEVRGLLQPERGGTFVDCTADASAIPRMLLEAGAARLIAIDRDADALAIARPRLPRSASACRWCTRLRELGAVLDAQGIGELGVC